MHTFMRQQAFTSHIYQSSTNALTVTIAWRQTLSNAWARGFRFRNFFISLSSRCSLPLFHTKSLSCLCRRGSDDKDSTLISRRTYFASSWASASARSLEPRVCLRLTMRNLRTSGKDPSAFWRSSSAFNAFLRAFRSPTSRLPRRSSVKLSRPRRLYLCASKLPVPALLDAM